jgi:hypothetical protein
MGMLHFCQVREIKLWEKMAHFSHNSILLTWHYPILGFISLPPPVALKDHTIQPAYTTKPNSNPTSFNTDEGSSIFLQNIMWYQNTEDDNLITFICSFKCWCWQYLSLESTSLHFKMFTIQFILWNKIRNQSNKLKKIITIKYI